MNPECLKIVEAFRLAHEATKDRARPMTWRMYCTWLDLYLEKIFQ